MLLIMGVKYYVTQCFEIKLQVTFFVHILSDKFVNNRTVSLAELCLNHTTDS